MMKNGIQPSEECSESCPPSGRPVSDRHARKTTPLIKSVFQGLGEGAGRLILLKPKEPRKPQEDEGVSPLYNGNILGGRHFRILFTRRNETWSINYFSKVDEEGNGVTFGTTELIVIALSGALVVWLLVGLTLVCYRFLTRNSDECQPCESPSSTPWDCFWQEFHKFGKREFGV